MEGATQIGQQRIRFTQHALDRFVERVRPAISTRRAALREMRRLAVLSGHVTDAPPVWLPHSRPADAWLLVGDDIALPLHVCRGRLVATSTLVRGCLTAGEREHRNRVAAQRRRVRRVRRRKDQTGRPPQPEPIGATW